MNVTVIATFAPRRPHVGARALVHAQLRVRHLDVRERPQPEDRAVHQQRIVEAEHQFRELRENATASSAATVVVHATVAVAVRAMRVAPPLVGVVEVEAHERLPHARRAGRC